MLYCDIAVILADLDRVRHDKVARHRAELPRRESRVLAIRRAIGRSMVRIGARMAAERTLEVVQSR